MRSSSLPDDLIPRCLQGDAEAWDILVNLIRSLAERRYCDRLHWSPQDVEDLVQDVCEALVKDDHRLLRSYKPKRASLVTYLASILANKALHFLRERSRHDYVALPANVRGEAEGVNLERLAMWEAAQRVLDEEEMLILRLRGWGYPHKDIAFLLERLWGRPVTVESVRKRQERALRKLRRALREPKREAQVSH